MERRKKEKNEGKRKWKEGEKKDLEKIMERRKDAKRREGGKKAQDRKWKWKTKAPRKEGEFIVQFLPFLRYLSLVSLTSPYPSLPFLSYLSLVSLTSPYLSLPFLPYLSSPSLTSPYLCTRSRLALPSSPPTRPIQGLQLLSIQGRIEGA